MPLLALDGRLVDLDTGVVRSPAGTVALRTMELALLKRLYAADGDLVPRAHLMVEVWGYARASSSRRLDTTVSRLRAALESDPARPSFILTHQSDGYSLVRRPPRSGRPLVDRDGLLGRIGSWILGSGWLTLAGPGGIGKSHLLEAIAELPRGGRPLIYVDLPNEGFAALASATSDPRRIVLADLGASAPSAVDGLDAAATVVAASRFVLDRRGETVCRVPPIDGRLPLAMALADDADRARRLHENLESTLGLLSEPARAAWAALPGTPPDEIVEELFRAGVVAYSDGLIARLPCLEESVW